MVIRRCGYINIKLIDFPVTLRNLALSPSLGGSHLEHLELLGFPCCWLLSFPSISFHFVSFSFLSFHFLSFPVIFFSFLSCPFLVFIFLSAPFISCHFLSFPFISFHFGSLHFLSFPDAPSVAPTTKLMFSVRFPGADAENLCT